MIAFHPMWRSFYLLQVSFISCYSISPHMTFIQSTSSEFYLRLHLMLIGVSSCFKVKEFSIESIANMFSLPLYFIHVLFIIAWTSFLEICRRLNYAYTIVVCRIGRKLEQINDNHKVCDLLINQSIPLSLIYVLTKWQCTVL